MDRKSFLRNGALAAFSLSTFGNTVKSGTTFIGDCETTNDILGPYYRENSPEKSDLLFKDLTGSILNIRGKVYAADCTTALSAAKIEIWHCDTTGTYDNDSSEFKHRGMQKTNDKGEYQFKTILPGKYLNGALYRPSHIHFRITAENKKELISQIYFNGDPHIDADPWASDSTAQLRTLKLFPESTDGSLTVEFNIYLNDK